MYFAILFSDRADLHGVVEIQLQQMTRPVAYLVRFILKAFNDLTNRIISGLEIVGYPIQLADFDLIVLVNADEVLVVQEVQISEALLQFEYVQFLVLGKREYSDRAVQAAGENQLGLFVDALQRQNLAFLAFKLVQKLLVLPIFPHLDVPFIGGSDEAFELFVEEYVGDAILRFDEATKLVNE